MQSGTLTTRFLEIDGMSCDACVQNVRAALRDVAGVTTQSVKVGSATIDADQAGCNACCAALNSAGYKARESTSTKPAARQDADGPTKPVGAPL